MAAAGRQQGQQELEEELRDQMGQLDLEDEDEEEEVVPVPDLQTAKQHAEPLTLDPDTAHPKLVLSDDTVSYGDNNENNNQNRSDQPLRFKICQAVLAKECFSKSFYFEVQVEDKTGWTLGVAREPINREKAIALTPQMGYWTICLRNEDKYEARAGSSVHLSPRRRPEKVGVFVDYLQGLVSFYDADTADLICSFPGCDFKGKLLYPFFKPGPFYNGKNSAPLVITPVRK